MPEGAGRYAARLEPLLRRIPDGWGRWISCDAGWLELIVDLDAALSAMDPDHRVEQVKERFGHTECCREQPSRRRTLSAIAPLAEASVLTEFTGLRRNRMWQAREVLTALDGFAARAGIRK